MVFDQVTGLGSIYVNGGKFEIADCHFNVGGETYLSLECQNKYALSMVVRKTPARLA
jgi:hypothetical protein